jgi:TRAP-type C4-dicarboxylate transport system substrate-binding protein
MVTSAAATSKAFHEYVEKHGLDEFKDVHPIVFHTHGAGLLHTKTAVKKLEDLKGLKIRGATRVVNEMLQKLDATPIGMPVPAVPEALSRGVIDGTTIPWEVSETLKVPELVRHHTSFSGKNGLYTLTFIFAMNKAAYEKLLPNLKAVIDQNSGPEVAAMFGHAMDERDKFAKSVAQKLGNDIITLDEAETARWKQAAAPVIDGWIKEMKAKGVDGKALVDDAKALIAQYSK